MFQSPPETASRRIRISIPSRYTVRAGKAETGGLLAALVLSLPLAAACLVSGWGDPESFTVALLFLGIAVFCGVRLAQARKFSLSVEGETLEYRRRGGPPETFSFRQIAWVRWQRERYLLLDENRRELCRVLFNAQGLDLLLADLRSRGAVLWDGRNEPEAVVLASPGPRWEEAEMKLPVQIPEHYCLRNPLWLSVMPGVCGLFLLGLIFWMLLDGERILPLCTAPFFLLCLAVWRMARREYVEVTGDRLHIRPAWGKRRSVSLSGAAAVRVCTSATGLGDVTSLELLDGAGAVLAAPGPLLRDARILLADLNRRGIPFTYRAEEPADK